MLAALVRLFERLALQEAIIAFDPQYGLIAVFGLVLVQQLGAPIPATLALMLAGSRAVADRVVSQDE